MASAQDELTTAPTDALARKPHKLVPFALLALGSSAVIIPLLLLRRARARTASDLMHAPPRRAGQVTVAPRATPPPPSQDVRVPSDEQSVASGPGVLDPLYALRAFGIATCVVGASAAAGVWAVRWGLGVQSTEEFAARMRTKVRVLAPALSTRIYRTLTPADAVPHESPAVPDDAPDEEEEEWTWADAAQRLSRAYDEGGMLSWMEAAGRELEREARVERRRRGHHGHESQGA